MSQAKEEREEKGEKRLPKYFQTGWGGDASSGLMLMQAFSHLGFSLHLEFALQSDYIS